MNITPVLRIAAVASMLSALTTLILIYGPNAPEVDDFASSAALYSEPLYLYKRWVLFFHPQFAFLAALGLAFVLFRNSPALVSIGLFYLLIWAVTEMTQQAYTIDALNQIWRPAWLAAESQGDQAAYYAMLTGFSGISDSLYFVLLFGFGAGTLLFGLTLLRTDPLGRVIAVSFIIIGSLSLLAFVGYYLGPVRITVVTGWIYGHLYGPLQSGVRILLGVWLWRQIPRQEGQQS